MQQGGPTPTFTANLAVQDRSIVVAAVFVEDSGSHLGHIFGDGPAPTGKRHSLNGVSLVFRAA